MNFGKDQRFGLRRLIRFAGTDDTIGGRDDDVAMRQGDAAAME
jgi:hypothetical protein